jgi:hypothetical protein
MPTLNEIIKKATEAMFNIPAFVLFTGSLFLAAITTLLLSIFQGYAKLDAVSPYVHFASAPANSPNPYGILLLVLLIGYFTAMYITTTNQNSDILTPMRKRLSGTYKMTFSTWRPAKDGRITPLNFESTCKIGINAVTQKLYMELTFPPDNVFEPSVVHVTNISISIDDADPFLIYYAKPERMVGNKYQMENHVCRRFEHQTFAKLKIVQDPETQAVTGLSGQWYDLNGDMFRLFSKEPIGDKSPFPIFKGAITLTRDSGAKHLPARDGVAIQT